MSQENLLEFINQLSLVEDSPVSPIALQENVRHLVMSVISGRKSKESYAKLNHDGFWVKMSQDSVQVKMDNSSEEYCETWGRWGIMSGGVVGGLSMSEPVIGGRESSLLLTPSAMNIEPTAERFQKRTNYRKSIGRKWVPGGLAEQIATIPTPRANDRGNYQRDRGQKGKERPTLTGVIVMIPTITCNTGKNTSPGINFDKREAKCHLDGVFMNQVGKKTGLQLQPAFAEWMMGFPIGYTDLLPSEMPLSRSKSIWSSKQSQTTKKEGVEP